LARPGSFCGCLKRHSSSSKSVHFLQVVAERTNPEALNCGNTQPEMRHHLVEQPLTRTTSTILRQVFDDEGYLPTTDKFTEDEVALLRGVHKFKLGRQIGRAHV